MKEKGGQKGRRGKKKLIHVSSQPHSSALTNQMLQALPHARDGNATKKMQ